MGCSTMVIDGVTFSMYQEMLNASSLHDIRPDLNWSYRDKADHHHRWYVQSPDGMHGAQPPWVRGAVYSTPTLEWITDSPGSPEDSDEWWPERGHWQCRLCKEHIAPVIVDVGPTHLMVPGLKSYYIDDESVSFEEFERRLAAARQAYYDRHGNNPLDIR